MRQHSRVERRSSYFDRGRFSRSVWWDGHLGSLSILPSSYSYPPLAASPTFSDGLGRDPGHSEMKDASSVPCRAGWDWEA